MKMGDSNHYFHLKPLVQSNYLEKLWVTRTLPEGKRGGLQKTEYIEIKGSSVFQKLSVLFTTAYKIIKKNNIDLIVSFNAIPYGLIATILGVLTKTPVHVGFVGSDWNRQCCNGIGSMFNTLLKRADFITSTGRQMQESMIKHGYCKQKVKCLPHSIDVESYEITPYENRHIDFLYIGNLIELKRVDLIISAFSQLNKKSQNANLYIAGSGPLDKKLKNQVNDLGLGDKVQFTGQVIEPRGLFINSRAVIIASRTEGFPFSLVEAMVSGAIPIATRVGDIPNNITHGETGLLVQYGDVNNLHEAMLNVLLNTKLRNKIYENLLVKRNEYMHEHVTRFWNEHVFKKLNV